MTSAGDWQPTSGDARGPSPGGPQLMRTYGAPVPGGTGSDAVSVPSRGADRPTRLFPKQPHVLGSRSRLRSMAHERGAWMLLVAVAAALGVGRADSWRAALVASMAASAVVGTRFRFAREAGILVLVTAAVFAVAGVAAGRDGRPPAAWRKATVNRAAPGLTRVPTDAARRGTAAGDFRHAGRSRRRDGHRAPRHGIR